MLLKYVKFEEGFIKPSYFPDVRAIPENELKNKDGKFEINDETLANYFEFDDTEKGEIDKMPLPIHPKPNMIIKISCADLKKKSSEENDSDSEQGGGSRKPHRFTRRKSRS